MKYRSPIGGLNSLTKLSGGLHILRILLLVPLTILLHLRKAAAAVLLGLMLLLDLAANLLARRFDLADGFSAALDSIADLLIQAALLVTLLPRFPKLGVAVWALLARLVLALVPDWIALLRIRRAFCKTPLLFGYYQRATFLPIPRSSVAELMPSALNTRLIVGNVIACRPLSIFEICDFFTPIFSPSSSCVRFCLKRSFFMASPT